jgi:hypothetical protein
VARKSLLIGTLAVLLIGVYYLGTRWGIPWANRRPDATALLYVPPPDEPLRYWGSSSATAAAAGLPATDAAWQRSIQTLAAGFNGRFLIEFGLADESSGFKKTKWFAAHPYTPRGIREMTEEGENGLSVRVIPGTALIEIGLRLPGSPDDAPQILQYMIDRVSKNSAEIYAIEAKQRRDRLVLMQKSYKAQYAEQQDRLAKLPVSASDLRQQYQIEDAREQQVALRRKLDDIAHQLQEIDEFPQEAAAIRVVHPAQLATPR